MVDIGWTEAGALFAAGAFGVSVWTALERWRDRPKHGGWWIHRSSPPRGVVTVWLSLDGDQHAHHVTVDVRNGTLIRPEDGGPPWPKIEAGTTTNRFQVAVEDPDSTWLTVTWTPAPVRRGRRCSTWMPAIGGRSKLIEDLTAQQSRLAHRHYWWRKPGPLGPGDDGGLWSCSSRRQRKKGNRER